MSERHFVHAIANFSSATINGTVTFAQGVAGGSTHVQIDVSVPSSAKQVTFFLHQYGDLSNGAESTGSVFNPTLIPIDVADAVASSAPGAAKRFIADLGTHTTLAAASDDSNCAAVVSHAGPHADVSLIGPASIVGRAVAVYLDGALTTAAVIGITDK